MIVYELPLLPNDTASETFLHKIGSVVKCWLDIYCWGAGPVVTGRIHDNGQNVYNLLFKQEVAVAPVLFLIAVLKEVFIRIILYSALII
jgi:hypothetical protein